MASLTNNADGTRTVQVVCPDRKRRTVRLGRVTKRQGEAVRQHVEALLAAVTTGSTPPDATSRWLRDIGDDLHDRIARTGLTQPRRSSLLGPYLAGYLRGRKDVKPSTRLIYGHTMRNLRDYFGQDKPMTDITANDADHWRRWLEGEQGLSVNTARRRCGLARQFFRAAVRGRLIAENPFTDLDCGVRSNRDKVRFISREVVDRIMDQCPDHQWRLILALSRFGGLRCPSEHLALTWADVDWAGGRFTVRASKTEHCEGGGIRVVPIFPELAPYLRETFEMAAPGDGPVITRYRTANQNLRRMLYKFIDRAGLKPWPKIFQNLRSTRQTELADHYPAHVVCYWMGNSQTVAREHYLQVPEHHYQQATGALQNPVQPTAAGDGRPQPKTAVIGPHRRGTDDGGSSVGATGLEPVTYSV